MKPQHSHDDANALTIACPACIDRVRRDQDAAAALEAMANAPMRTITITYDAEARVRGTTTAQVRCPADWTAEQYTQWIDLGENAEADFDDFDGQVSTDISDHLIEAIEWSIRKAEFTDDEPRPAPPPVLPGQMTLVAS